MIFINDSRTRKLRFSTRLADSLRIASFVVGRYMKKKGRWKFNARC
jgi:hypothetical protein